MGHHEEQQVHDVAARQLGLVSADQCARAGFTRFKIRSCLASGRWVELHPKVYKTGPGNPTPDVLDLAALLALEETSALSHHSAARRLQLDVPRTSLIHVSVPRSSYRPLRKNVVIHRTRDLSPSDLTRRGPYLLTGVARTVIDLAAMLNPAELRILVDSALRRDAFMFQELQREAAEHRNRPGLHRLRLLLEEDAALAEVSDSALESLAMELGFALGRAPVLHHVISPSPTVHLEVDFAWPQRRLAVELDGYAFHANRTAFEMDRTRDRLLTSLGWTVLRYTWHDLTVHRDRTFSELSAFP